VKDNVIRHRLVGAALETVHGYPCLHSVGVEQSYLRTVGFLDYRNGNIDDEGRVVPKIYLVWASHRRVLRRKRGKEKKEKNRNAQMAATLCKV